MKTKIIPAAVASDRIKNELHIGIESMSITYVQPADTNSDPDDIQTITVIAEDGSCVSTKQLEETGESGMYLSIKTDRWSFDDLDSIKFLLEDFKQRLNISNVYDSHLSENSENLETFDNSRETYSETDFTQPSAFDAVPEDYDSLLKS